jgi:hypothetical protein
VSISKDCRFIFADNVYQFVKMPCTISNDEMILTFIGKKFLSKKEFSHWKNELANFPAVKKEKVYYISL